MNSPLFFHMFDVVFIFVFTCLLYTSSWPSGYRLCIHDTRIPWIHRFESQSKWILFIHSFFSSFLCFGMSFVFLSSLAPWMELIVLVFFIYSCYFVCRFLFSVPSIKSLFINFENQIIVFLLYSCVEVTILFILSICIVCLIRS